MKENGGLLVLPVPVRAGHGLERLDLPIDPLAGSVGNPVLEVDQKVRQVVLQGAGGMALPPFGPGRYHAASPGKHRLTSRCWGYYSQAKRTPNLS